GVVVFELCRCECIGRRPACAALRHPSALEYSGDWAGTYACFCRLPCGRRRPGIWPYRAAHTGCRQPVSCRTLHIACPYRFPLSGRAQPFVENAQYSRPREIDKATQRGGRITRLPAELGSRRAGFRKESPTMSFFFPRESLATTEH